MVGYLVSLWSLDEMVEAVAATEHEQALLRTGVVDSFRAIVQERIAADGVVRIAKDTGAFVAH